MNSSGEPTFCTAFWTVSGEQATRIWTLAELAGAALTRGRETRGRLRRELPLRRSVRASARLAGPVRVVVDAERGASRPWGARRGRRSRRRRRRCVGTGAARRHVVADGRRSVRAVAAGVRPQTYQAAPTRHRDEEQRGAAEHERPGARPRSAARAAARENCGPRTSGAPDAARARQRSARPTRALSSASSAAWSSLLGRERRVDGGSDVALEAERLRRWRAR